jgi:choline dehydrogenase-like flavoprotein
VPIISAPDGDFTNLARHVDTLVIGAGTAGCVLANRLSADRSRDVLLLEAGPIGDDPRIDEARRWPSLLGSEYDWGFKTIPQPALAGRSLPYPRGKVLGGSSAINAMGHHRGHAAIYDRWEEWGNPGWSYEGLMPLFRRCEDFSGGADRYRGAGGPISVVRPERQSSSEVAEAFLVAAAGRGHGFTADFNGSTMLGAAWNQLAIRDGIRQSASRCYLLPVLDRPNLTVLCGTAVLQLWFEGTRCRGVSIATPTGSRVIEADEIFLCAGAIDTPRLLMLSGIGDAGMLTPLGIKVLIDLPGVGRNLQDHALAGLVYRPKRPLPVSRFNHADSILYGATDGSSIPDMLIMCVTHKKFATEATGPVHEETYSLVAALMRPKSRGHVSLASSDPRAPACIDPQTLAEADDWRRFTQAMEEARELGRSSAFDDWRDGEILPGPGTKDRAGLRSFIREATTAFFHAVGTCRMGRGPDCVVDERLHVRGVEALRVVDASIIPEIPDALTNAAVYAIAEKAASIIDPPLAGTL